MKKLLVKVILGICKVICFVYNTVIKYLKMSLVILAVSLTVSYMCYKIYDINLTKLKNSVPASQPPEEIQEIFNNVARVTEVTNKIPPLAMLDDISSLMTINAFTTGHGIYITVLADKLLTTDEKALVLGHEMAHVILHHTDNAFEFFVDSQSNENELMADNLGATWADKAGYNVCKGREAFLKFYREGGNSLNADHPPNTLRYDNLAHYCKN